MDPVPFIARIQRLGKNQAAILRFAERGMDGLRRLDSMISTSLPTYIPDRDRTIMMCVLMSRDWGGSQNRTYNVCGLKFCHPSALEALARDIESIDVAEHGAKSLMTGREKLRKEAAQKLIDNILTPEFLAEIEEWDLKIDGTLMEGLVDKIPWLGFELSQKDGTGIAAFVLDGWSGRIAQGVDTTSWGEEIYRHPGQLQNKIRAIMLTELEKLTGTNG